MGLLDSFLYGKGILVGDGGVGTMLISGGQSPEDCLEWLNTGDPEAVLAVHRAYAESGADVLTTNTFCANFPRLASFGLNERMSELNFSGARLARQIADSAGREILVAGSVGPAYPPMDSGDFPHREFVNSVSTQCRALVDGGVDYIFFETMRSMEQIEASLEGARLVGDLPIFCTMSFPNRGKTSSGISPRDAVRAICSMGLQAFGVGCGPGPVANEKILEEIFLEDPFFPVIVQSSSGLPRRQGGSYVYDLSPDEMASHAVRCREIGARYIGGCCGTSSHHIRAVAQVLRK